MTVRMDMPTVCAVRPNSADIYLFPSRAPRLYQFESITILGTDMTMFPPS